MTEHEKDQGSGGDTVVPSRRHGGVPRHSAPYDQIAREFAAVINRHSLERTAANTPDFVLGQLLMACLGAFSTAIQQRALWYGAAATAPLERLRAAIRDYDAALHNREHATVAASRFIEQVRAVVDTGAEGTDPQGFQMTGTLGDGGRYDAR